MFEGFDRRTVAAEGADIHLRLGGHGPPLLLLHGYPQTSAMWHRVAPGLAERFTVVAADLRGYGGSAKPPSDPDHLAYSKRVMARDMVQVMAELGFGGFAVAGHDRGGRVGYRMALDHPAAVTRLAVLDIVPTFVMWQRMDRELAMATYHWLFLAQPDGLPETMIGADPAWWVREKLRRWAGDPDAFAPEAVEEYVRCFADPAAIHASCEDYWAGAGSPARCWSSGARTASPAGPRTRWPPGGPCATTSAARASPAATSWPRRRPPRPWPRWRGSSPRGRGSRGRRPAQGLSSTSSMARSLCSVSTHSVSGSEPGTMPAPASRWARRPSRVAPRRAITHSPSPRWSTQPTGPA